VAAPHATADPAATPSSACPGCASCESGDIGHPLALTAAQAYRFLRDVLPLETSGLSVRIPDWWQAQRGPRPQVSARLGTAPVAALGAQALLDFSVAVALPAAAGEADHYALGAGPLLQAGADSDEALLPRWRSKLAQEDLGSFFGIELAQMARDVATAAASPRGRKAARRRRRRESGAAAHRPSRSAEAKVGPAARDA